MPENITPENLINDIMETLSEGGHKHHCGSSFEGEISKSVTSQFSRLFGRQEPLHKIFGGGKSADVLLWRNKKISAGFLAGATAIWVLFEWLNYHFVSLVCFAVALGLLVQFLWSNASGVLSRSSSQVPRIQLPEELFVNTGKLVGSEINQTLRRLQNVSCNGNLKPFLLVVGGLLAAGMIGSWCNFLTVIYIGFVAAHTLPVLYEKYEDEVDSFVDNMLGQMQHHYKKIDTRVLRRIPTKKFWGKKSD